MSVQPPRLPPLEDISKHTFSTWPSPCRHRCTQRPVEVMEWLQPLCIWTTIWLLHHWVWLRRVYWRYRNLIWLIDIINLFHHHHYVPSVVNRSAVMDLHRSRSCATLIQSLYDIFVHSLMLSVHIVLGLPRPLLPFILPSLSNRCIPSPLIICPKYWHFLFLIVFNNDLLVFILCKTSALVLCSFHDILNILLYSHISKASNLSDVT